MSKPTIKELLTDLDITDYKVELLAERVEAVLKEIENLDDGAYETIALSRVRDLLNGEQP